MGINYNSSYDEILKKIKEEGAADLNKSLADNDATHNLQKQTVTDNYNAQLKDTESTYADDYRANAVQKLINEREVAESMANLGLTDSGLNRTQQTAVQLSYANKNADIDRQKRSMVDSLKLQLNNSLNEIETSRISNASAINQTYESAWADSAQKVYNDNLDYLEEVRKEQIAAAKEAAEKEQQLLALQYGTLAGAKYASNGNIVYTDTSGNTLTARAGTNPYTANTNYAINKDVLDSYGNYDPKKVFSNGYQPNNYNGSALSAAKKEGEITKTTFNAYWRTDGVAQKVWKSEKNKYYVWVGPNNAYYEVVWNNDTKDWDFA